MLAYLNNFIFPLSFIPHGHCYLWKPELVSLHSISDFLIASAYYSIPITLLYFVRKREDLPFNGIFLLFGVFIIACGSTHLMEIWTIWHPQYWLSGSLKAFTAVVSVYTAIQLVSLVPKALAFPSPAQLETVNRQLEEEILAHKRSQTALRNSEEKFRTLSDCSPMGIFLCNLTGECTYTNPQYQAISGLTLKETLEKTWVDLVHPEERDSVLADWLATRQYSGEFRILTPQGILHWVHVISAGIYSDVGTLIGHIGTIEDITERKQAEKDLTQRALELERSNAELEKFAYVASHDLQEPLRMVSSYTQLLGRRYKGKIDSDADEFINFAVDGVKRMQVLINDLLAYSRVGSQAKPFVPTNCALILPQVRKNLQLAIADSAAVITYNFLPTVLGDSSQLIQLFQNLLGNAIKFHKDSPPQITIEVEAKNNEWLFAVRDNGIGIEPDYAERIFIIFQRLHTRDDYPGTGIGLAICKKIVERHGGKIWVEPNLPQGSVFYFTLPMIANG
jgi:PAS domain S-box-containing protein